MQGSTQYQRKIFLYVNMEDLVPENHILKKLDKIFDLSFVRDLTKECYSRNNGRPSIDPELFFRMILIGYLFNISKDRKLCEEISLNIAYRWYCRLNIDDPVPDHSSISRIKDRYGAKIFRSFFNKVVNICKSNGLVKGERIMVDSSLLEADASLDSMITNTEGSLNEKSKLSNETHTSITDPDSTLAMKKGSARGLRYKSHFAIDADSRVILNNKVTTGNVHESNVFLEQINFLKFIHKLSINEIIADRAYGAADNLLSLKKQDIKTFIPLFSGRVGKISKIEKEGVIYDKENNRYICPEGKFLNQNSQYDKWMVYRSSSKDCNKCAQKHLCPLSRKHPKYNQRIILRSIHQNLYDKEMLRMKDSSFKDKLKERMWKIEGIIAEAKNLHTMARAKYRGLSKVQIQADMVSAVQNLKRLLKHGYFLLFSTIQSFLHTKRINIFLYNI